ncbi:hypothetical protein KQI84_15050 [bacterium]|nr:hypothetical protein [bacterium]
MVNRFWKSTLILVAVAVLLGTSARAEDGKVTPINSREYFPGVVKLIDGAKHSVNICLYEAEYYLNYPDSPSNALVEALIHAAERGVEVTAVIDRSSFWAAGRHDIPNMRVAKRLAQAGAMVYLDPDEITSHQKVIIVDRDAVVVASANWKHYSLVLNNEVGVILWSKEAGREYYQYFAKRVADAAPFVPEGTDLAPLAEAVSPADVDMATYPAADIEYLNNRWYYVRLAHAIREAQKSIDVVQNYAKWYNSVYGEVPGRPAMKPSETNLLLEELVAAKKRGVRVRVCMDLSWTSTQQIEWDDSEMEFANRLDAAGIEVYRDDPGRTTHAKMLLIDNDTVVVGSTNWSFEALEKNNEASVLVRSKDMVTEVYRPWVDDIFATATNYKDPLPDPAEVEAADDVLD